MVHQRIHTKQVDNIDSCSIEVACGESQNQCLFFNKHQIMTSMHLFIHFSNISLIDDQYFLTQDVLDQKAYERKCTKRLASINSFPPRNNRIHKPYHNPVREHYLLLTGWAGMLQYFKMSTDQNTHATLCSIYSKHKYLLIHARIICSWLCIHMKQRTPISLKRIRMEKKPAHETENYSQ